MAACGRRPEKGEEIMRFTFSPTAMLAVLVLLLGPNSGFAQPAPQRAAPLSATPSITLAEARTIIDGALAFARQRNMRMAVLVMDDAGEIVASERMDGASASNMHFAEGKAFAALMLRQTTENLGQLAKTRPDRYFGIMNMYPGRVYLVGGGEPLAIGGRLVGAVGVAGLPQGVDEMAGRAGIAAWERGRGGRNR
jgi:uncharacterized protein GlcG (DUF336 family)